MGFRLAQAYRDLVDSPREFDEFARGRQLDGLDHRAGFPAAARSNDFIALGRRFRSLGALTTVGVTVVNQTPHGERASVMPEAYCELMCVFLLLSGKTRYVPEVAHVRDVHDILYAPSCRTTPRPRATPRRI